MQIRTTIELWQKGKWVIAKMPELDFVTQGRTIEEAKSNLKEVVRIQFEEMKELGTLEDYLAECGFEIRGDNVEPINEMIGFEKQFVQVN
ncbi:MAG: type II toxin-antitoxin system HicB family antitoxin [Dissulfurispiraceae bacterium]